MKKTPYLLIGFLILTILTSCTLDSFESQKIDASSSRQQRIHSDDATLQTSSVSVQSTEDEDTSSENGSVTHTKDVSYATPSREGNTVTRFTLSTDTDGAIVSVAAQYISGDHEDQRYQNRFSQTLSRTVVGKKISDIRSLDTIGGASLTTEAFQQYVSEL